MHNLQIFNYGQSEIRTVVLNGEPWWVAKDVCEVLGLEQVSRAMDRLEPDERGLLKVTHPQSHNKEIEVNGVNEPGLYSLIMASNKPEAKAFKRWITHEVIPAIRRHGAYMTDAKIEEVLSDPDTIIKLATDLKAEREKRKLLEIRVEADKPKVLFADAVSASKTSILVGELAKLLKQNGIEIGQNRLFEWMRKNGFLISRKGTDYNMPTQRSMELELFEIKETSIAHSDGHTTVSKTPKVTGKGQVYFVNKFKADLSA